jgi:putative hydrolase
MTDASATAGRKFNQKAAGLFREFAALLRTQHGNPFRINAYNRAAATLESLDRDTREILRLEGADGLTQLPTIGSGLASSIEEIARTGRLSQLDRLRGSADPAELFRSVPGVGKVLSQRLFDTLHVDTLEELEQAAHDGRLASVPGVGARRVEAIKAGIASLLNRGPRTQRVNRAAPGVDLLLDVDAEYRDKASRNKLPKLAPKRFNPEHEAWLPVLHTEREPWHFSALYSNTALAHELGRTDDWVVIYFYDDDHREGQCTVVTEVQGEQRGRRVVRGREAECREARTAGN